MRKVCACFLWGMFFSGGVVVEAARRPDIAILLTDQQQAGAMSVAGTPGLRTPAMDGLAREGVRCTHAFCPTPQCSPARAAMWTGLYPHRNGVMGNVSDTLPPAAGMSAPWDVKVVGIGEVFSSAGYETAYFGKWHLGGDPGAHGFQTHDTSQSRGKALTEKVLAFLERRVEQPGRHRPLLLIVSWINPHDIYSIDRERKLDTAAEGPLRLPVSLADDLSAKPAAQRLFLTEDQGEPFVDYRSADWRRYLAFYYRLVERVDAEIGEVVEALRRDSPAALIAFTSDHGDLAGAHGLPFKGPAMYEELVRIPMIISWPGQIRPGVSDELVSHIDLLPTLCELAGVEVPTGLDGRSMKPLLLGDTGETMNWREAVFSEYYGKQRWRVPIRMVRTKAWKYVRYRSGQEELYDLRSDPHEMTNLAGRAAHAGEQSRLADRLDRWMRDTRDPFMELDTTDRAGRPVATRQSTSAHSSP